MQRKSFTLLEMMVVLVIIFIITAIAMPNFWGSYKSKEIKGSARSIASILSAAKSYAQAQNIKYDVVFWCGGSNIDLNTYKNFTGSNWDIAKIGKSEKHQLTNGVVVATEIRDPGTGYHQISFYPDGHADDDDGPLGVETISLTLPMVKVSP